MNDDRTTAWFTAVEQQLGLDDATDNGQAVEPVDQLAELVGAKVDGSATARTMYLLGLAAGRSAEAPVATKDYASKLTTLAEGWDADSERAEAPNDQAGRA